MPIATKKRVIVVGGGLAGLACTIKLAEEGIDVDLFSMVPVKRSHSVCAQGGINACNDVARQQGYSEYEHFDETVLGGDFLADQPPVLGWGRGHRRSSVFSIAWGVPSIAPPKAHPVCGWLGGPSLRENSFPGGRPGRNLSTPLD